MADVVVLLLIKGVRAMVCLEITVSRDGETVLTAVVASACCCRGLFSAETFLGLVDAGGGVVVVVLLLWLLRLGGVLLLLELDNMRPTK